MTEKKVSEETVAKALSALKAIAGQDVAKSKGQTATTKEVSMVGESGATQVFHTPSNSDPGSWAGSSADEVPENGASDGIAENGTDYGAMAKSILDLVAKGKLSTDVAAVLLEKAMAKPFDKKDKEDMEKAANCDDDNDADDMKNADKDQDKGKPFGKSLADRAAETSSLKEGLEVSDFLRDFVSTFSKSLADVEARLAAHIDNRLGSSSAKQEKFNKSLAESLVSFGEVVAAQTQRIEQVETAPARAPKSQMAAGYVQKSFAGSDTSNLSRTDILSTMDDMVRKGLLQPQPLVKFESTGQISDDLMARVVAHRSK